MLNFTLGVPVADKNVTAPLNTRHFCKAGNNSLRLVQKTFYEFFLVKPLAFAQPRTFERSWHDVCSRLNQILSVPHQPQ